MTRITSTDDNYHQYHQYTTIPEAQHHTDHNQETILTITHISGTIETIKDIAIRTIIITIEGEVIIETIITEVEPTVTTETIIITNTTIADQAQDTQTAVTQDKIHRTTEIIIITIIIIDKDNRYRQRSGSNSRHYSTNNNRDDRRTSTQREQIDRYHSKDRRTDGNKYNNNNKNRINNIKIVRQNDDPTGIDDYEYTSESSNEDQEILDKFYNANEDTCNTVINTLESNPTWILPIYQCNEIEHDFTKQRPILEIDFLLNSGATLNLLNEDTWNEINAIIKSLELHSSKNT